MNYKDLLFEDPNGDGQWLTTAKLWRAAHPEDIANAVVHKFFHYSGSPYYPEDVWQDPLVTKVCELLGTNLIGLKNRKFRIDLRIMPEPTWMVPSHSAFQTERQEISPIFFKRVADELMQDKTVAALIDAARVIVPKAEKSIGQLRIARIATLVTMFSWYAYENLIRLNAQHATHTIFLLPLPLMTAGIILTRLGIFKQLRRQGSSLLALDLAASTIAGKQWVNEALKNDFAANMIATKHFDGRQVRIRLIEFDKADHDFVTQTVQEAEDIATSNPQNFVVYKFQAQPRSPELGSTTIGMLVSQPNNPSPPKPPKDHRKKRPEWRPDWPWVTAPAHAR